MFRRNCIQNTKCQMGYMEKQNYEVEGLALAASAASFLSCSAISACTSDRGKTLIRVLLSCRVRVASSNLSGVNFVASIVLLITLMAKARASCRLVSPSLYSCQDIRIKFLHIILKKINLPVSALKWLQHCCFLYKFPSIHRSFLMGPTGTTENHTDDPIQHTRVRLQKVVCHHTECRLA